ncbi:glycosyltransferase family 39 protein [uncultured Roseibium sp.]|uniref:glycosyltransferase family 39 protein n=1 Tax=uncultured Roseibium sp. TaxID=1936171 RepID=UPI002606548A|nr:glycosyltransferase family 39 protein [uncultured Roseibium sp.]
MLQTDKRRETGSVFNSLSLAAVLLISAALRFVNLDRTSLWYDEAVSWSQSNGSFSELLTAVSADNYPPLHNIILWLTMPFLGDSEIALRVPSAILGTIAVWLTYLVGRSIGSQRLGLLAAALLCFSPFHIWYSTEARMYALLATCGLGFLLSVLNVLKQPSRKWLVLLTIFGALFLYSHIYALLAFAPVGLTCAAYALRDVIKNRSLTGSPAVAACIAMGASAIAFFPWLLILAGRARSVAADGFWIAFPDLNFLKNMAFAISGSLELIILLLGFAAIFLVKLIYETAIRLGSATRSSQNLAILLAYTFGPLVLAYVYSVLVQPILFDRYLIAAWPGFLLLASAGACSLQIRLLPPALVAASLILSYSELSFTLTEKIRPEWREIVQDYREQKMPNDKLVLYKGFAAPALEYYLREPSAFKATEKSMQPAELSLDTESGERWLLVVHSNAAETEAATRAVSNKDKPPAAQRFGWGASGLRLLKGRTDQ